MSEKLLAVNDLAVTYRIKPPVQAVDGVSFTLESGQNLGIVGESGCGKTTIARAVMGLLPRTGSITGGKIHWKGHDITNLNREGWNAIRWSEIALIPQSAMNCLDPVYRIRDQIMETIQNHENVPKDEAAARADALCRLVGIDPQRLNDYPHQLSGGMKQRIVIAMALALKPDLIIADEPTTALDVIVQDRILKQIVELQQQFNFAMIYISHDIGVIAETCHQIAVMYAGKIIEYGPVREVLRRQAHPYTMGLKNAFPDMRHPQSLISIPGHPPTLDPPPPGCRFAPRCPFATDHCRAVDPPLVSVSEGHFSACHYAEKAPQMREESRLLETWERSLDVDPVEQIR